MIESCKPTHSKITGFIPAKAALLALLTIPLAAFRKRPDEEKLMPNLSINIQSNNLLISKSGLLIHYSDGRFDITDYFFFSQCIILFYVLVFLFILFVFLFIRYKKTPRKNGVIHIS